MFKEKGWKVINADETIRDPIFKITPNILPAGEGLIWALAKETGRYVNYVTRAKVNHMKKMLLIN